jgi:hypothetical protein
VEQLSAELENTYPTASSTEAQAIEYSHAERGPERDHRRPHQQDQSSGSPASSHVNQSPVLSPVATEFRNWLTETRPECVSAPNIVVVTDQEPGTPDSDETYEPYEPSDELPDYVTPVDLMIPRMEVNSLVSSTTTCPLHSETPKESVRECQPEAPHWVRHTDARSSASL